MDYHIVIFIVIALYVMTQVADFILEYLNLRFVKKHGNTIPPEFQDAVDPSRFKKSQYYTFAKSRYSIYHGAYNQIITLVFIFGGILNYYNNVLYNWHLKHNVPFVLWGIVFVMLLSYAKTILNIPFNLINTFGIEKRFGFNTMSFKLWLSDLIKGLVISTALISLLLAGAFWLVETLENYWWLPVWGFFFIFSLFVIYITPYILEPLFNKFTPLDDEELAADIKAMLKKAGIKVKGVYQVDASRRTKHSNAYFTGLGKVKRIVIYDNLLKKLEHDELLGVLAHEAAHCRKKHVFKNLLLFELLSGIGAFVAFLALKSNYLSSLFGIKQPTFFANMILLSFVATIVLWGMPWFFNIISRRFERQADDFTLALMGNGKSLASALIKLSADNLSNIHPQKFYAMYHYSHPPDLERVRALLANKKQSIV